MSFFTLLFISFIAFIVWHAVKFKQNNRALVVLCAVCGTLGYGFLIYVGHAFAQLGDGAPHTPRLTFTDGLLLGGPFVYFLSVIVWALEGFRQGIAWKIVMTVGHAGYIPILMLTFDPKIIVPYGLLAIIYFFFSLYVVFSALPEKAMGGRPKKKSSLATLSLIFSCCSIATPLFIGSIAGIVCGHMAMREFQRNPELEGKKEARWCLIIGYVSIPTSIALGYLASFFWGHGR